MLKPTYRRLVSIVFRSRASVVASFCLLIGSLALAIIPVTRGERSSPANPSSAVKTTSSFASMLQPGVLQLPSTFKPTVIAPRAAATSLAVRSLPLSNPQLGEHEGDAPLPIHPPHAAPQLPVNDPVQQKTAAAISAATVNQTFDGLTQAEACGGCIPPDPVGAVGPNHYVEMVNSSFAVYSKTGTRLSGPTNINSLFQTLPASAPCRLYNDGDPVVVYDHLAD